MKTMKDRLPALSVQDGIQATHMVLATDRAIHMEEVQEL